MGLFESMISTNEERRTFLSVRSPEEPFFADHSGAHLLRRFCLRMGQPFLSLQDLKGICPSHYSIPLEQPSGLKTVSSINFLCSGFDVSKSRQVGVRVLPEVLKMFASRGLDELHLLKGNCV